MATGHAAKVDAAIAGAKSGANFALDVSKWVAKAKGNTNAVIRKIFLDLGARIIMRTPVDTGRARANWMFGVGNPKLMTVETLDKSGPTNSQGMGSSTAKQDLLTGLASYDPSKQQSLFLTNSLPYIKRLEYGWSGQAPAGMVRVTVAEFAGVAKSAIGFVKSQGGNLS